MPERCRGDDGALAPDRAGVTMAWSRRTIRRLDRLHTWSSLACTAFLLLLCITGLPLIFHDDIDAMLAPPMPAPAAGTPMGIDALVAEAMRLHPGLHVQFVFWDGELPHALGVGLAEAPDAPLEDVQRLMFDVANGAPLPAGTSGSGAMDTLLELHRSLLVGLPGQIVLALVAIAFLLSLASGVALYAPFAGRRAFAGVRNGGTTRKRWLDLHNVHGIVLTAWLVVVGATGLMNALEGPLFAAWQAEFLPRLLAPYQHQPYPEHLASVDTAVATARAALPGMHATSVGFPCSRYGSPRHYLIWMRGDTPLTAHFFTPVLIDASSGALASAEPLPWYLRLLEISRPLHFGDYGGLPLKILWAMLDLIAIAIVAGGAYLWLGRRRQGRAP